MLLMCDRTEKRECMMGWVSDVEEVIVTNEFDEIRGPRT